MGLYKVLKTCLRTGTRLRIALIDILAHMHIFRLTDDSEFPFFFVTFAYIASFFIFTRRISALKFILYNIIIYIYILHNRKFCISDLMGAHETFININAIS